MAVEAGAGASQSDEEEMTRAMCRDMRAFVGVKAIIMPRMAHAQALAKGRACIMSQGGTKTIHIAFIDGAKELRCCNLAHEEEIGIWNVVTF